MLLFWARLNTPFLKRIPLSVAREIGCFFDNHRIVDVQNSCFYYTETNTWSKYPLAIEIKSRPPLLVWSDTVYLFGCGGKSKH